MAGFEDGRGWGAWVKELGAEPQSYKHTGTESPSPKTYSQESRPADVLTQGLGRTWAENPEEPHCAQSSDP